MTVAQKGDSRLLRAAQEYALLGFRVLPARGKKPILSDWPAAATTDLETVEKWWQATPSANIGLALGRGVVALDVDAPHGQDSLRQLEDELGELPDTVESRTPSGGKHLLFRTSSNVSIKNRVALRPCLDVRADGGQIIVAPSVHPETGTRYEWREGRGPHDREPAELPPTWVERLTSRPAKLPGGEPGPTPSLGGNGRQRGGRDAYGQAALETECADVAGTPEGGRNARLNKAAFAVGQLVSGGELEELYAVAALLDAALAAGLPEAEARRTIRSGFDTGQREPRTAPPREEQPPPRDEDSPGWRADGEPAEPDLGVLESYRRPAPPLPLELLGRWGQWCADAAEGAGTPVDYVAGGLLGVAAGTIGNAVRVSPWRGWEEPSVLWVGLVGDPSSSKSPALDPFSRAVSSLERRWREPFEEELSRWKAEAAVAEAWRSAWKQTAKKALMAGKEPPEPPPEPPEPPICPRLRITDVTPEALASVLEGNPRGVWLLRDELAAWLGGFGRYAQGAAAGERAMWIECYGARSHKIDRKGPGSLLIPRMAVSITGTTQPGRLDSLVLSGDDDGLASRFLWTWPEPMPPRRPRRAVNLSLLERALEWLRELPMPADDYGDPSPVLLSLSPDATDTLQTWREEHHEATRGLGGLMASAAGKAPGLVLRLALVLELLDVAGTSAPPPGVVSQAALLRGIALWTDYFAPMAQRVYGDAALPEADRDASTLARWIAKERPSVVNARKLRRKVRLPGLTKVYRVEAAIGVLIEAGWLAAAGGRAGGTPGRQRADFRVRPELFETLDRREVTP